MIDNHTRSKLPEIHKFVSPKFCNNLALKTGFVKRSTSRLSGYEFVNAMILGQGDDSLFTYAKRIIQFSKTSKLSLPALAQRINSKYAERLMLEVFGKCLISTYEKGFTPLKNIKRILIQDSTCLSLNQKLAEVYAGSGGHKKTAGIKLDCIYDYTNEKILHISHHARTVADAHNCKEILEHLQPQDLVLRDLGYFNIEELKNIEERSAHFISRLRVDVKVYINSSDSNPVDFISFLRKKMNNRKFLDETVYIGQRKKKVRLIVNKLPEEVINEKLRKAKRAANVNRTTLSEAKKALLIYTVLITNLPLEHISTEDIITLYRVRWRIELLFKEWKSQLKIENIIGTNIHRIRCLIFGRLCLMIIMNKIMSYLFKKSLVIYDRELSIKRALDLILKDGGMLVFMLSKHKKEKIEQIAESLHLLLKNKYKNRKTTREIILNTNLTI